MHIVVFALSALCTVFVIVALAVTTATKRATSSSSRLSCLSHGSRGASSPGHRPPAPRPGAPHRHGGFDLLLHEFEAFQLDLAAACQPFRVSRNEPQRSARSWAAP
jgi:hypothetical protein